MERRENFGMCEVSLGDLLELVLEKRIPNDATIWITRHDEIAITWEEEKE